MKKIINGRKVKLVGVNLDANGALCSGCVFDDLGECNKDMLLCLKKDENSVYRLRHIWVDDND